MSRVGLLSPSLSLGGAERSLVKFASAIALNVDQVIIFTLGRVDPRLVDELDPRVRIVSVPGRALSPFTWMKCAIAFARARIDVLIGWSTYANFVVVLAALVCRPRRLIVSERCYVPELYGRRVCSSIRRRIVLSAIRVLYCRADVVTANSGRNLKFLRRFVGASGSYQTMSNTVDMARVDFEAAQPVGSSIMAIDHPRLLALGRLTEQKGFDILLAALADMKGKCAPNLLIVGSGKEEAALKDQARRLGVERMVQWVPAVANPFPYYKWADVVVVPSRYEGFPNVPLEAMACGAAVVMSDCRTGPRELSDNGRFGRLFPVEDVSALAQELLLLCGDRELRERTGAESRSWVISKYSKEVVSEEYISLVIPAPESA